MPISSRLAAELLEDRLAPARSGVIDTTFGAGGRFDPTTAGGVFDPGALLTAVAVQPDGKVVAAGRAAGPGGHDFLVVRLTPDGATDPTFGTNGRVVIDFTGVAGNGDDRATAVAIGSDGRITVGGEGGGSPGVFFLAARLTATGSPDPTFGTGGRAGVPYAASDLGPSELSGGMTVDSQNRVLAVGTTGNGIGSDGEVIRLTAAGQLDTTFDADGRLPLLAGGPGADRDVANAVAVQTDGTIVVVGTTTAGSPGRFQGLVGAWAVRLADDGSTAPGTAISPGMTRATAVAAAPAGGVVIAGDAATQISGMNPPGPADFALARRNADGTVTANFGTAGNVTLDRGADDRPTTVAVAADGRIVVAGGSAADFPVARFNADGTPDADFNSAMGGAAGGVYTGGLFSATAVAFQGSDVIATDGAIIRLLGQSTSDTASTFAVTGPPNGQASLYSADRASGQFVASTTLGPFTSGLGSAPLRAATGDVDGDGVADTVLVTGPGVPIRVAVVRGGGGTKGEFLVSPFDPFGGDFTGGGFVAVGDLNRDGRDEIIVTPDQGGGPRVAVFSVLTDLIIGGLVGSANPRASFLGIDDPNFRGGARAAVGDVNGDGVGDLVVAAGFGGGPRTAIFGGPSVLSGAATRLVGDFFAFPGSDAANLRNGAFVAVGDVDGDGDADLIFGGGPGGAPRVFILSGAQILKGTLAGAQANPIANFFVAGNSADRGGVRVAAKDADGDGRDDVVVGSGEGAPARVRVYLGRNFTGSAEPTTFQDIPPFSGAALADGVYVG